MLFMIALFALSISTVLEAQTADLVVTGARVYTVDPAKPSASAIAVKGDRILAVGDDVSKHVGPATRKIDAKGATIVPGLIDSHVHMHNFGRSLEILDLRATKSAEEIAAMVKTAAGKAKPGEWIAGRGWDQTRWPSREFPTTDVLSSAAKDNPVILTRVDGHAGWVNKKAMDLADINARTPDPDGGKILKDDSGKPTGILIDTAQGLVRTRIPAQTAEQVERNIEKAARECARLGMTTVHDAGVGREDIEAYRALIKANRLPVRAYVMIGGTGSLWDEWLKKGPETGDKLTVRSIKLVGDGALGSRGAAMIEPYSDDPKNRGLIITGKEKIEQVARQAAARGFQVNTHAIGDQANRNVLQAYAAALGGKNDKRFRVEHAQIIALEDMKIFRDFSIIASIEATHATSDMRWAEQRIGPERIKGAYAWKTLMNLGVHVPNGSDFPVEDANPLWGFYSSVTRQDHTGYPAGGWRPQELMTREEALRSWTIEGAYAAFEEKTKGSLTPGKLADFVMLSKDIMKIAPPEILKTKVTMTVLGGAIVHQE